MRDSITRYFAEVGRLSLPTKEEERRGFAEYKEINNRLQTEVDPAQRSALITRRNKLGGTLASGYLRFVNGQARDRTRDEELRAELISAGNEGLMVAVERFDPAYDVRFLTYAAHWVRVKMDEVLHRLGTVHISVHTRKQTLQRGDGPPEPIMTPIEDIQIASDVDVEQDARPEGEAAMMQLHSAGLNRLERLVLTLSLGLRGQPHDLDRILLILYGMDGVLRLPYEIHAIQVEGIEKMREWHDANPEARAELVG